MNVPSKHTLSTPVDGEIVEVFKYLKVSIGSYVFYSDFHARDMDNVVLIFGYPWMQSVGTININVEKKLLKLWYTKKKVTLQDISLTTHEEPKGSPIEISTENLVVIPTDTSNDESMKEETKHDTKT